LEGFDRGPTFDDFLNGPKIKKSEKTRRRCEKRISAGRVGGTPVLPEELLEFAKSNRFVRVCKLIWDALSPASRGRRIYVASDNRPRMLCLVYQKRQKRV
jgi:hypothetical protein